ncbi:MAG: dienelactone hydrolase family protein [Cyanobium sp. M30B3]|nr:MAG: dienelactone hydrolase family protein [Cyanobium sp. M30B3]
MSAAAQPGWQVLAGPDDLSLRCWWSLPAGGAPRAAVLVLPEVFGLNGWVRSVADRLAAAGYAALAVPVFARTAPDLELDYDEAGLAEGRRHRDAVTAGQVLADLDCAIQWLQCQPGLQGRPVGCVGFCFGGHLAMLAATLPQVAATCDFYGARVSTFRPGGGDPTLSLVPRVPGHLFSLAGANDPLMPATELAAIDRALAAASAANPARRFQQLVLPEAGHGFMCEARADFQPEAARQGWAAMLELFGAAL